MIWMSILTDLTLSLLLWPAAFQCQAAEPAAGKASCSCPPCTCKDKCDCETCKCDPCPAGKDGAVCCPPWAGCSTPKSTIPNAPVFIGPYNGVGSPCQGPACGLDPVSSWPARAVQDAVQMAAPAAGCPVFVSDPASPKTYEVQVRLNREGCRASETCCTCPRIALVEGGHALVSMNVPDETGKLVCQMMHVHLCKVEGDCVNLALTMAPSVVTGLIRSKPVVKMHGEQTVHLDTVTGVVLSGNSPDPCCAQVVVSPVKNRIVKPQPQNHCEELMPPPIQVRRQIRDHVRQKDHCEELMPPPVPCPPPTPRAIAANRRPITEPVPVGYPTMPFPPPAPPWYVEGGQRPVMTYLPAPIPEPAPMYRQPPPPMAFASFPAPPYPPMVRFIDMPAPASEGRSSLIRVVHESGKAKLKMKTTDGMSSTSVRMKVETDEMGCLRFAAGKTHVHVSGKQWKACADRVEFHDDGRVLLMGHVKVVSGKVGVCSSLKGDHACLEVHHGKIENIDGGMFSKR